MKYQLMPVTINNLNFELRYKLNVSPDTLYLLSDEEIIYLAYNSTQLYLKPLSCSIDVAMNTLESFREDLEEGISEAKLVKSIYAALTK